MAIHVSQAFHRTSANPIDESMALTKAQMLTVNDNIMPAYYFTICQDDGAIYLYDKTAEVSDQTGKFRKLEAGSEFVNNTDLGNLIVALYDSEKADYAVDDYVIYNKKLYRCKTANTTNPPTNTTDWVEVNILDTIDKKVNEHVPDLSDYVNNTDLGELVINVYDPSKSDYAVDDYVIYLKKLYRCKIANTANLPTNTTDWEKVNIIDTIDKKVNEHVPDLSDYVNNSDLDELVVELYDSTKDDYAVDDFVIYQKKLYRCKVANTTKLPTVTSDWEKINILQVIDKKVTEHVPDLSNYVDNDDLGHLVVELYSNKNYRSGDYCIKDKRFYQAKSDIQAEGWTPSHWNETNIVQVIQDGISSIDLTPFITDDDLTNLIAAHWNQSSSYPAGFYVIHDRNIYRSKVDILANTAWNYDNWNRVTLVNIFSGDLPGLVPPASEEDHRKVLGGDGTWKTNQIVDIIYNSEIEELHINLSEFSSSIWTDESGNIITDSNGDHIEVRTRLN